MNDSRLSDLLDISLIQTLADSNIRAGGLPMTIVDARDSSILVMSSWPEVCSDLHRDDPLSPEGCIADSNYIPDRFGTVDAFQYKCKYGLCHIAIPIIVAGRHMGTMFLTPFFFEDQLPELKQPAGQSAEAGFDKHGYLSTFDRIPVFNAEMVDYILAYDRALVHFIADLAERSLRVIETKKSPGESEERYRTLVYNLNLGIYRKNPDIGRFIRINSAMPKIFGYASDEEFLNVPSASLYQNPDDRIGFIEEITRQGFVKNIELQMKKKDGTPIWCSVTSSAKYTKNRKFKWIDSIIVDITERKKTEEGLIKAHHKLKIRVRERTSALANANDLLMAEIAERKKAEWMDSVIEDITERKKTEEGLIKAHHELEIQVSERTSALANANDLLMAEIAERKKVEEKLRDLSEKDHLTMICNRRKLFELLALEVDKAKRYKRPLSMIILDLDHFKAVNDRYGHNAGDAVLKTTAALVGAVIRNTDIFARYGGEEFIILSPETDMEGVLALAEKVRASVERHAFPYSQKITVSAGVSEFHVRDSVDTFIDRTDRALYMAKRNGRNRVEKDTGAAG